MNSVATIEATGLPAMLRQAAQKLASAETAAEVLEARAAATELYDEAKKAARLAKAKGAHDTVITTIYRVQADGLEIEAAAKRRLADEYDAAQAAGQVTGVSDRHSSSRAELKKATAADVGLTRKEVHDARAFRDAELREPGITKRAVDTLVEQRREPTRAAVRRELYPSKPQPIASDQSLWIWGRLLDFERKGILNAQPHEILSEMPPHMIADVRRLAPQLRNLLEELEVALEHA